MAKRKMTKNQRKAARKLAKSRAGVILLLLIVAVSALVMYFESRKDGIDPNADAEFHFIDVGQGDSAMIITDEVHILVDCGTEEYADTVIEYVKKYTDSIDLFVMSHPHDDHMGGAAEIMSSLEVKEVMMADSEMEIDTKFYTKTLDMLEELDIPVTEAIAGKSYVYGDVTIDVFSPAKDYFDHNNNSIVMKASVDGASVMFTGDAETPVESDVLESFSGKLKADVLKVGHHGSTTSSSQKFLEAVAPDIAVISVGEGNTYGHPKEEILERLENLGIRTYRTDKDGVVVLVCRDGKIVRK
ncbi:MAG: MBL fold metallo-hydrolase [Clostridia bacterium]|nr:MBL fold metallo-hydrolase [Clostridia bacterium]